MSFYEKCVLPAPKKASFVANDRKRVAKLDFGESNKKSKSFQQFNLKKLTGNSHDFTRTNDEVHHTIDICPVMKAFMDTEQFQRLRNIKQLGASYLVYSSADHNRYQHSIGVAYLAREMCSRIRNKQRSLGATDKDILCVTLAGLLHDIGHGPFSHIYEVFRAHVNSEKMRDPMLKTEYDAKNFPHVKDGWSHEESSLLMIDAALASLGLQIDTENLDRPLKQIGDGLDALTMRVFKCDGSTDDSDDENVLTSRDFIFVKECIFGKAIPGFTKLIGRQEPEKEWLYDIVANRHNGLDVDKVDYFARDERRSLAQAGKINIQILYDAFVAKARCNDGKEHYMICYPVKCVEEVMDFFRFRFKMHGTVYQHKTSTAGACMIVDILKKADLYHEVKGANGQVHSLSSAVIDSEAFLALDDTIIQDIKKSKSKHLEPARKLAKRYLARDLYKLAGELNINDDESDLALWQKAKNCHLVVREICAIEGTHEEDFILEENDVIVERCSWHYGRKGDNPLLAVRFVNRKDLVEGNKILNAHAINEEDYETILPRKFMKQCIRVYCRDSKKTDLLAHKFLAWTESLKIDNYSLEAANTQGNLEVEAYGAPEVSQQDAVTQLPTLTQDSEDDNSISFETPKKARKRQVFSPSPVKCKTPTPPRASSSRKQRGVAPIPHSFEM